MSTNPFVMSNDMSDLCRVCFLLPEESQYLDLTTIYDEEDNLTYGECFTICTQIDLSVGEGVPHHLCKSCGLELQMSYDFHKKVEESKRLIEQWQKQIIVQNPNDAELPATSEHSKNLNIEEVKEQSTMHIIDEKYIISDDEQDLNLLSEESCVMREENVEAPSYINEETDEIDMNICGTENNMQNQVPSHENDVSLIETMNENDEGHIEIEDYQNLEALEEEAKTAAISSTTSSIFNSDKLQNIIFINRLDFCANVQRYDVPPLTEETLIVEEISQDATEKWLDTLTDATTHCSTNTAAIKGQSDELNLTVEEEAALESTQAIDNAKDSHTLQNLLITTADNEPKNHYEIVQPQTADSLSKNIKKNICTICDKTFKSANKLSWHMRMHDKNRKRFICPIQQCGRIYASKQSFDLHYKQTHLDEGFLCQICQKIFSAKQTLEVHMRYHTKEFPYQCNLCERKFSQKGHLTQHVEVKHHNLRYICTETDCGKVFQNSVSLRNHRYTHSSMPFKCSRCDKQYPQKNKLRHHLLHKHGMNYSLEDLEEMRQFNIIRTRHAFVKVQAVDIEEDSHNLEEDVAVNTNKTVQFDSHDLNVDVDMS